MADIRLGLDRIGETMQKVAQMSRATRGDRRHETFAVGSLLMQTEAKLQAAPGLAVAIRCDDRLRDAVLSGDLDLWAGALCCLSRVAHDLSPPGEAVRLGVDDPSGVVEVRVQVHHARLQEWELPRTFEPYQLNRILRDTTAGLDLFLVRLVAKAHGGDAYTRRLADQGVEFCLVLGRTGA